jgi:hypothetical protein
MSVPARYQCCNGCALKICWLIRRIKGRLSARADAMSCELRKLSLGPASPRLSSRPSRGGKFVIIDGQHRTTAAALIGFDSVPCQVVIASREQQATAFKAINGITVPISPMALHAAAVVAREPWAIDTADICLRAEVELLRYPLPVERQRPGQTMAVGAITQCLKRFGPDTLITALQCVTQTANNKPGALTSRMIRALCEVLHSNDYWRDSGLALLEAFDTIELAVIQTRAAMYAGTMRISQVESIRDQIHAELSHLLPTPEAEISTHSPPRSTREMSTLSERH